MRPMLFLHNLINNPAGVGAISPSSKYLAQAVASSIDFAKPGIIIELGGGTGAITNELVKHDQDVSRLVVIEFEASFCQQLRRRFQGIHVINGDAYNVDQWFNSPAIKSARAEHGGIAAVVSCLPLLNRPVGDRIKMIHDVLNVVGVDVPFLQFTYGLKPPVKPDMIKIAGHDVVLDISKWIYLNVPPARVMAYRLSDVSPTA